MQYDRPGKKVWRYLSPIIVYYCVVMLISFIGSMIITWQLMDHMPATTDTQSFITELMTASLEASVPIYLISGLAALPLLWRMLRRDMTMRRYTADRAALKKGTLIYCALAGILSCLSASILVTLSSVSQVSEGYSQATESVFSQPVILQFIAVGFVMPVVEEVMFRGLIYNRMKDYMKANLALVLSAALFGIYHGNLIQGVYGFVMGILMVFVYEKYQTLAAPVICHIGANLVTLILQLCNIRLDSYITALLIAAACLGLLYLVLHHIQKKIHIGVIPNPRYIDLFSGSSQNSSDASDGIYPPPRGTSPKPDNDVLPRKYTVDDYYPRPNEHDESKEE